MTTLTSRAANTKTGPAEAFILGVVGIIAALTVVGGLVLSVVSIAVGDGQIGIFTHSDEE